MMKARVVCGLAFCLLSTLAITGCAAGPVLFHSSQIEVLNQRDKQYLVVEEVNVGDMAKVEATFTWDYPGDAGKHDVRWNVYEKDKLVRAGKDEAFKFTSSPFIVYLNVNSTAFNVGEFRCVLFVDGAQVTTIPLKIVKRM